MPEARASRVREVRSVWACAPSNSANAEQRRKELIDSVRIVNAKPENARQQVNATATQKLARGGRTRRLIESTGSNVRVEAVTDTTFITGIEPPRSANNAM